MSNPLEDVIADVLDFSQIDDSSDDARASRKSGASASYDRATSIPEFFGFETKHKVFSLNGKLEIISRDLKWGEEPARAPVLKTDSRNPVAYALPLTVPGLRTKLYPLNPGLVLVSGSTAVGKSAFIRALSKLVTIRRILAVEPYDFQPDENELETLPMFSSVDAALTHVVRAHYADPTMALPALDSLRAPLFETNGAAGTKGIIRPFFTQLTRVSNALARAGITLLATINPMEDDPAFTDDFLKKLSASTSTSILLSSAETRSGEYYFSGTIVARPNRTPRNFTLVVPKDENEITNRNPDGWVTGITFDPYDPKDPTFDNSQLANLMQRTY